MIHKVNLEEIRLNIDYIEKLANELNMTDHLEQTFQFKIRKAHEKLTGFYPRRFKRGLVNALGKVIKFVAGNPDQEDLDLINQNLEVLEYNSNKIIDNQVKQIKINNLLQTTINKVSKTLRSIKQQIDVYDSKFRKDFELINLILNLDILIKTLEDLEEQIIFSKSNQLNKNILSLKDKDYIWNFLKNQELNIKFEEEIYKFIQSIVSLQNNHIVIIIKIPIIEQKQYRLMQLEPININGTRIDTDIRYVANHQQTFYEQKERCFICDNYYPVNDECIFNILTNQRARCSTYNQPDQPIIKEISIGTILIDTDKTLHIGDSCGDSRIISAPTIIETGNCTVTVQNFTFKSNPKTSEQHEYLTPIFGKEIIITKQKTGIDEVHQMNLDNLEEIKNLKLHMTGSQIIGGIVIASIVLLPLIIFCFRRYRRLYKSQLHITKRDATALRISRSRSNSLDEHPKDATSNLQKENSPRLARSFFTAPRFMLTEDPKKSTEDARHLEGRRYDGSRHHPTPIHSPEPIATTPSLMQPTATTPSLMQPIARAR